MLSHLSRHLATAVLVTTSLATANINLYDFNCQTVNTGKSTVVHIDTLLCQTEVDHGIATTTLTMTLRPDGAPYGGITDTTFSDTIIGYDTIVDENGNETILSVIRPILLFSHTQLPDTLDSLEIRSWFTLPYDFVAKELYLWINGVKKRAEIQNRFLARGQYDQIVNRRSDPALLEYFGNGDYQLSIFPAESFTSRTVEIVFEHTLKDTLDELQTCVPVTASTDNGMSVRSGDTTASLLGHLQFIFRSVDNRKYKVDIPGIGTGEFGSAPLTLIADAVYGFQAPRIRGTDPSLTDVYAWTAFDKRGRLTAGCELSLSRSDLVIEPEPAVRVIALDIRATQRDLDDHYRMMSAFQTGYAGYTQDYHPVVNINDRARKAAIAAIRSYVGDGHTFNLVIGGAVPRTLFEEPVALNDVTLNIAAQALLEARPDPATSTLETMRHAVKAAHQGIVIFISDLLRPWNYEQVVSRPTGEIISVVKSDDGAQFDSLMAGLDEAIHTGKGTLFTICDEWELMDLAYRHGGFNLANLSNRYFHIEYEPYVNAAQTLYCPKLPPLYPVDAINAPIVVDNITCTALDSISYSQGARQWHYRFGIIDGIFLNKSASISTPGLKKTVRATSLPASDNSPVRLLLAGLKTGPVTGAAVPLLVEGKIGGLRFSKTVQVRFDNHSPFAACVQWPFRYSEMLSEDFQLDNNSQVTALGVDYHIVTRQTSLLALEDGVELWNDSIIATNTQNRFVTVDKMIAINQDMYAGKNGVDIDSVSFASLTAGTFVGVINSGEPTNQLRQLAVKVQRGLLTISVPALQGTSRVEIRMFDMQGRLVLSRNISTAQLRGGVFEWNINAERAMTAHALYMLNVRAGDLEKTVRINLER